MNPAGQEAADGPQRNGTDAATETPPAGRDTDFDAQLRFLFSRSATTSLLKVIGSGLRYLQVLVLAAFIGATGIGAFYWAFSVFSLLGLIINILRDVTYVLVDPRIDFDAQRN